MAKKKEHIKFSHNEFLNLSEYLREKNTDNESIKIINSVEYCIHLIRNMSFADKFDLESDIIPFIGFSFVGKNEDAIFKEFRKAYINLKNNLGDNKIIIEHKNVHIDKSIFHNIINIDDIKSNKLSISIRRKLSPLASYTKKVETQIFEAICERFNNYTIISQYHVKPKNSYWDSYRIDCYFIDLKIAVEIDEWGHCGYDNDDTRQKEIKKKLKCKFVRYNPFSEKESLESFLDRLDKVILKQEEKYKPTLISPSLSKENLIKLNMIAHYNNTSIDKIIDNLIDVAYNKATKTKNIHLGIPK